MLKIHYDWLKLGFRFQFLIFLKFLMIQYEQSYFGDGFHPQKFSNKWYQSRSYWVIRNVLVLIYIVSYAFLSLSIPSFGVAKFKNNFGLFFFGWSDIIWIVFTCGRLLCELGFNLHDNMWI